MTPGEDNAQNSFQSNCEANDPRRPDLVKKFRSRTYYYSQIESNRFMSKKTSCTRMESVRASIVIRTLANPAASNGQRSILV